MPDPCATHISIVAACASRLAEGARVLELGAGIYSTPLLHAICGLRGIHLTTIDSNKQWLAKFIRWDSPSHNIHHAPVPCEAPELAQAWDFVFIDGVPLERRPCMDALRTRVGMFACHDTQAPEASYHYNLETYKYRYDWKAAEIRVGSHLNPWTSIVSDTQDTSWLADLMARRK